MNWDKAWADAVEANEQISSNKDKWLDFGINIQNNTA
jgi:hypothetical protein